ncbi:MAG: pseudouridine synthase [Thermoleophilia bacterium]|nr:pseudouridine synthase [Thermoleophilia bacterium]
MPSPRDPFLLPGDKPPVGEKLQKFISGAGVTSRRHAEVMIKQGRVTVNGKLATLGMRVVPGDTVRVGGVEVGPQAPRFFMLNKPTGIVTTLDDPQGRATVATLVPDDVRVYPVGRLDIDTSGLLLLTNDGELAHRLMHPSFGVTKTYRVLVQGGVSAATARQLAEGVELEDGMTAPAEAKVVDAGAKHSVLELTIHEGRNRQVRRMCEAIGHPVIELARTAYGPLVLAGLAPGASRPLTDQEIRRLRKAAGLAPARTKEPGSRAERRAEKFGPPRTEGEAVPGDKPAKPAKPKPVKSAKPAASTKPKTWKPKPATSEDEAVQRDRDAGAGGSRNANEQHKPKQRTAKPPRGSGPGSGSRGKSGGGNTRGSGRRGG